MLLDIGVGILAALWLGEPVWLGVAFSLLPDIDALISMYFNRDGSKIYKHRDMLHLPVVYIAFAAALYFLHPGIASLFLLCTIAHFVHDSIGLGWGVQWLWPLSTDHFSFLYLYQPLGKTALHKRWLYRWRHEDIDDLDKKHGDPYWLHNIYFKLHPFALVELAVFILALAILLLR